MNFLKKKYKPMFSIEDSNELLDFAVMQRMYEDGLWKNPNYYVGIDDYYAHFFLNLSMQYSGIECIEELLIEYDLKGMTFLKDIGFVKWMHDVSKTLISDSVKNSLLCDATYHEYLKYIDEMQNKLLQILQK